jgi:hypothetical protein
LDDRLPALGDGSVQWCSCQLVAIVHGVTKKSVGGAPGALRRRQTTIAVDWLAAAIA